MLPGTLVFVLSLVTKIKSDDQDFFFKIEEFFFFWYKKHLEWNGSLSTDLLTNVREASFL